MAENDGQQGLVRREVSSEGDTDREICTALTKFICGASNPDIVKNMLSDIEQRDSFFWLEMLTGTFNYYHTW